MEGKIYDRHDLIADIEQKVYCTLEQVGEAFRITQKLIGEKLVEHNEIQIKDFGTFERRLVPERTHRNPKVPGATVVKPAHFKVFFRPAKKLSSDVQGV